TGERRWRLHDLLLWQTQRTLHDHWYGESDNGDPYYLVASGNYLDDAKALADAGADEVALNNERRGEALKVEQLRHPAQLRIAAGDPLPITTQLSVTADWTLEDERGIPQGQFVIWPQPDDHLTLEDPRAVARRTIHWPLEKQSYKVRPT